LPVDDGQLVSSLNSAIQFAKFIHGCLRIKDVYFGWWCVNSYDWFGSYYRDVWEHSVVSVVLSQVFGWPFLDHHDFGRTPCSCHNLLLLRHCYENCFAKGVFGTSFLSAVQFFPLGFLLFLK